MGHQIHVEKIKIKIAQKFRGLYWPLSACHGGDLVAKSCLTLATPWTVPRPGSSVHGFSQARILDWVASSFSKGSFRPRDRTHVSCMQADSLLIEPSGKPYPERIPKSISLFYFVSSSPLLTKLQLCLSSLFLPRIYQISADYCD